MVNLEYHQNYWEVVMNWSLNQDIILHILMVTFILLYQTTVWMNEMPRFYVGKLILHHYRSDLAHLSYFDSLVIGLSKSEI